MIGSDQILHGAAAVVHPDGNLDIHHFSYIFIQPFCVFLGSGQDVELTLHIRKRQEDGIAAFLYGQDLLFRRLLDHLVHNIPQGVQKNPLIFFSKAFCHLLVIIDLADQDGSAA